MQSCLTWRPVGFLASSGMVINRQGVRISSLFSRSSAIVVTVENGKGAEGHAGGRRLAGKIVSNAGF